MKKLGVICTGLVGILSLITATFFGSADALAITGALLFIGFQISDKEVTK